MDILKSRLMMNRLLWMPINIYTCLTPPPTWKAVKHVRSIDNPDYEDTMTVEDCEE